MAGRRRGKGRRKVGRKKRRHAVPDSAPEVSVHSLHGRWAFRPPRYEFSHF